MVNSCATWVDPAERLDRVLPTLGLARSRSQASELIGLGRVRVNGSIAAKSGLKVPPGAEVSVEGVDHYVSRAAHKLLAGLDLFEIDPSDALALDVGASTGGFTQVLLERGARQVLAIDVGHNQLAERIRVDERVRAVEGCNARDLTADSLADATGVAEAPRIIVADLSFISLELVLPAMANVAAPGAQLVLLIKPQFEVGRLGVSGGIVTDPGLAVRAVLRVIGAAAQLGLACRGIAPSPITGEHGNQEVLAHFSLLAHVDPADPTEWEQRVREIFIPGGAE